MFSARVISAALVCVLVATAGCGAKSNGNTDAPNSEDNDGSDADAAATPPPVRRVLHIGLEYFTVDADAQPPISRVSLIFTDETGATKREQIGEFEGGCSDVSASARAEAMSPILALDCWGDASGVQLRFAHRGNKLYVVSAEVERGTGAPAYQPLKTIDLPQGTPVTTDHDH